MARTGLRRGALVVAILALLEGSAIGTPSASAAVPRRRAPVDRPVAEPERLAAADPQLSPSGPRQEEDPRTLLVDIEREIPITARPGSGRVVGAMPRGSRFYAEPLVAWVQDVSAAGRFGLVTVPYVASDRTGWIALRGLEESHTTVRVEADLSDHRITVFRGAEVIFSAPAATGAPGSPTPPGDYFVTDRVPFGPGSSLGSFAFGISGIQPNLPAGWSGGDQLAIHGTDDPSSIGRSVSAGCLRVSERVLDRLLPLLRLGTPVVIRG